MLTLLRRTSIYVQARNERVKNPLQKWYHSVTKDDKLLPVFCVSSKIYMAHLDERPSDTVLPMFCNTTGIPALRSYLFSLAAKSGKIEAFIRYCVSVRSLLAAVELACMGSGPMKRESLVRNLNEVRMVSSWSSVVMRRATASCSTSSPPLLFMWLTCPGLEEGTRASNPKPEQAVGGTSCLQIR